MNRTTFVLLLVLCIALVVLPLWASWKGVGAASVRRDTDGAGNIRYVGTRGWIGGGPSYGK